MISQAETSENFLHILNPWFLLLVILNDAEYTMMVVCTCNDLVNILIIRRHYNNSENSLTVLVFHDPHKGGGCSVKGQLYRTVCHQSCCLDKQVDDMEVESFSVCSQHDHRPLLSEPIEVSEVICPVRLCEVICPVRLCEVICPVRLCEVICPVRLCEVICPVD